MINNRILGVALAVAGMAAMPTAANAESKFVTASSGTLTASANLDFTITIPKFVYVRIGTGTNMVRTPAIKGAIHRTVAPD